MLKSISNLGKSLSKNQQLAINGGVGKFCSEEEINLGCVNVSSTGVCLCPFF